MADLNVDTSVVDYLKSSGKDSSFSARTSLAAEAGIKDYTGSAEQNVSLLGYLKTPTSSPTGTEAPPEGSAGNAGITADSLINGPMDDEIAQFEAEDGPKNRGSVDTVNSFYENLSSTLSETLGDRPEATSTTERYKALRKEAGLSALEQSLSELRKEARDIAAIRRQRVAGERGKRVATGVMGGRISEIDRQENERLDVVNREIAYINDQVTTGYNVINTIMNFEQTDYQNASQAYEQKFNQAMQTIELARGIRNDEKSEKEREQDMAAANLQIMYNALSTGAADFDALDAGTLAQITKLEIQSGLPTGFYKALKARAGQAEIVSTNSRESGGVAYTDVIMRKPDGTLYIETLSRGGTKSGGGSGGSGGGGSSTVSTDGNKTTVNGDFDFMAAKMADVKKRAQSSFAPSFANTVMSELTDEELRLFLNDYFYETNDLQMSVEPLQYFNEWKTAAGLTSSGSGSSTGAISNPFLTPTK